MRRGVLILLAAVVLGLITAGAFWFVGHRTAPADWLRREFSLSGEQARQATIMHAKFQRQCMEICVQIKASDERLEGLVQSSQSITPEIHAAIAESDQLRTKCRTNMLAHFYEMAAMLPADQRTKYLDMVLPVVLHPEDMSQAHSD
ncbi:hypothetical protein BH09VER1_BH09VER1_12000 [soil metagenome]